MFTLTFFACFESHFETNSLEFKIEELLYKIRNVILEFLKIAMLIKLYVEKTNLILRLEKTFFGLLFFNLVTKNLNLLLK